jgi:hypothetical protein
MNYKIAGKEASKRVFIKHLNSGYVANVNGAVACKPGCDEIMFLAARLSMGHHYVCNKGHEKVTQGDK